jgi:hypothetical protein
MSRVVAVAIVGGHWWLISAFCFLVQRKYVTLPAVVAW